jgi:hypothetical protein
MSIDALLYRPITQNSPFEGLIPPYQGQEVSLDKESDNSTTYDTLKYMDQWATKYSYQMSKVAPRLKGRNLKETVTNIYKFLYSHFQYKLDGSLQNLYSPSAAWHFRNQGFDCKTYSILASTILRNLNIPHTFRMVQQAGIMPGQWSHVYVIVPDKNTHQIIDATTHTNKEVNYTQKHDYTMIVHRGLASPYPYGALGCACQGTTIKRNVGLGAPATMQQTIANFHMFLDELEKKGFPREVTDRMLFLVKSNVENGIDPNFEEIVHKAIMPAGKLGEILPASFLTSVGSTYNYNPTTSPYASSTPQSSSSFGSFTGSALSNVSVKGINVGGAVSAVTGLLTGNPLAAIGLITNIIPVEKTFGAVFANGFDLSCWGASYSEQKAKAFLEKRVPEIIKESGIENGLNTNTLDSFLNAVDNEIFWAKNGQQPKYAKCTRKGYALSENGFQTLLNNTLDSIKQKGYTLIPNGKKSTTNSQNKSSYDSYIVMPPVQQQQQQQQQQQVTYQTVQNPDGTKSTVPVTNNNPEPPKTAASSTTPLLIGAGLLALKFLI